MSDPTTLRARAGALHLHGLLAHWSEVATADWVAAGAIASVLATTARDPHAMVTPREIEAQILRYYHAEKWTVGTIARQLHVHHSVVRRVLAQAGLPRIGAAQRPSPIDAYLPLIQETLAKFPSLIASRLFAVVHERGYRGSPDHFRHLVAEHRPRRPAEAYLRLRSLPGEQAQVDWAHFGHVQMGHARRPLMAFVMVLSHSRQVFQRFFPGARMESFLRGHVGAFTAWNGVPQLRPGEGCRR